MIENLRNLSQFLLLAFVLFASQLVTAQVTADFTSNTASGCSPLIVNFSNISSGTGLSYSWNLGNGNTSVSENPSASYINPGTYTITLTATGPGGTDTETKTGYITVFTPPIPDVAPSQNIGCYPFTVDFTDLSVVGDSPIATWSWDFGDGGTSTDENPSHLYTTPGTFNITLILTDANGCSSNQSFNGLIESNSNRPTAEFVGDPTVSCLPPSDVSFTNSSSGGTGVLTYEWNFGDGNTSTDLEPDNTYLTSGDFDVSLTVTDEFGCTDTQAEIEYIEIVDNVTIDFTANSTTICLGENVSLVDLSSPTPVSWEWGFGDGNTSTDQFPTHLYTTPGNYEVSLTATYSVSCQGTETKTAYITIGEIPFVNFTADTTAGCETPFPVQFTNGSVGGGLTYQWDFGDGNTSTDENPSNTYINNGVYTVSLTATNPDGCSSTQTITDYINIAETRADFLPDAFGFCQPLEVNFSDLSVSGTNISTYDWDFGDGGTSSLQNPTYTYLDTGIYDVSLVITNELGCTDTLTRSNYIFVYTPPVANFVDNDTVICPGELDFIDLSENATDWFWDFGDEQFSTEQNPTHEYSDTGSFTVILITLNNGCSDTLTVEEMVYVSPPIADLEYSFDCLNPNEFTFSNESYGFTSWNWILPDGSTSTDDPLVLNIPNPGEYVVRVTTANDTSGCVDTAGDTINVTMLQAGFSSFNTEDCGPLTVEFIDESVDAISWEWLFGSGDVSNAQNPDYTYTDIGTYSVTQVATDVNGCTDTIVEPDLVTVTGSVVNFGIDTTFGCETLSVQFEDLTAPAGTVASWLWDFGDGNTSTDENPLHVYQNAGTYTVSLTITDIGGCTNSIEQPDAVVYIPYPDPAFAVDETLGCIGDVFTFTNNSTGNAVSYQWNFGDGGTSTAENPVYSYSAEGTYSITLTAFNANGCDSSITEIALIDIQHPDADFSAFPTFAFCPPLLVSFTDLSSTDAVSWFWDFGNGSSSSLQNPSHIYTESGTFSVFLVVTNANGCVDTIFAPDLIQLSGPAGDFSFFPDSVGCPPYDITFTSSTENVTTYTWDFGDGFLGSGETATHTYTQIGSYIPTLILEDDNGCTFTYQSADTLYIEPLPVDAGLSSIICQFDSLQLNATGGDAYSWSPSTGLDNPNAATPYASPDQTTEYVVTVNLGLCENTDTVTVFVNPTPQVSFIADEVCFGTLTQFSDFSSIAAPDSITTWNWNLGEGLSTDTNPSITYSAPGTYDITLVVESSIACSSTGTGTVTVNPSPVAAFSANDTCLFELTSLFDQSTVNPGTITDWSWDLGNGSTSSQQNPSLTYFTDSVYQITLAIIATGGCTDTITQSVAVFPLPNASVTAANVCFGEEVQFGDSTTINSGNIAQWDWTFGDGDSSNDQHPAHLYPNSQTYVYSLSVISDNGCTDGISGAVTVNPLPVSDFQMTSTSSCVAPVSVNLFNQSTGANQFEWNHDNGTLLTSFNSTAIFDTVGQYNIQLLVTTQFGCKDSSTQLFEVFPTVIASFDFSTPTGCEPWDVEFTNLSENGTGYSWDFSDNDGSSIESPDHTFFDPGTYTVQLIVEGLGGCGDTLTINNLVTVWPNPTAQFEYTNVPSPIANGTIGFFNTSSPHVVTWWDFGDGDTDLSENTTHQYAIYGNKLVTLAIVDVNGCVDTAQMYISVDFFGGLYVPNAIIPQDPNSDVRVFQPKGTGLSFYRCMVYDKWGNLLWESNKLEEGSPTEYWDGTHNGEPVPQGAYVWKVDAIFANGDIWEGMENLEQEYHEVGTVTVIR
jgi:PKD repeat protein